MKLFTRNVSIEETLHLAKTITGDYSNSVLYHAFWNGQLLEQHFISIKSCYLTNIKKYNNRKIILWVENNAENEWSVKIKEYAEIKNFNLLEEMNNTPLENKQFYYNKVLSYYSDVVRYVLLYKYGGCWFDLDVFFIRDFSPLFFTFKDEVIVYQWEYQNNPNGAIYISLVQQSPALKNIIEFIIHQNKGWGFLEANINYDLDLNLLVLPCSWFDPAWIDLNPGLKKPFFKETDYNANFNNFYDGAFCYHWHNQWTTQPISKQSICYRLLNLLDDQ